MNGSEKTKYVIHPFISVNGFLLGKTRREIKMSCGVPFKVEIDNIMETTTEFREACSLAFEEKKLAYVQINKHAEPIVEGISIYSDGAIEQLLTMDPDHLVGSTYSNFRTLGICVGGFGKKRIPEGKLVIAYASDKVGFFDFYASE